MNPDRRVLVALERPPGYEDVHTELVVDDAMCLGWTWEILRDEGAAVVVAIDRPEGYERSSAVDMAKEAIKETWPTWSVLKRGKSVAS